jgi:hypothetical protein
VYSNASALGANNNLPLSLVRVEPRRVDASADLNKLHALRSDKNVRRDPRTADKLVDGCNVTTKSRHMWLVGSSLSVYYCEPAHTFICVCMCACACVLCVCAPVHASCELNVRIRVYSMRGSACVRACSAGWLASVHGWR